jgi:chemotaxis protein CheY-P-specific phosphatase CheC
MGLKETELKTTDVILKIGLSRAANSLSFFIKEKVSVEIIDISIYSDIHSKKIKKNIPDNNYILYTIMRGDIGGEAYLILSESEVIKLTDKIFPTIGKKDHNEKTELINAFLLELDNILTASVITEFANIFRCKLYGDVPSLKILNQNETEVFFNEKKLPGSTVIYINSKFITETLDITPEFIWIMDDNFFNKITHLLQTKTGLTS